MRKLAHQAYGWLRWLSSRHEKEDSCPEKLPHGGLPSTLDSYNKVLQIWTLACTHGRSHSATLDLAYFKSGSSAFLGLAQHNCEDCMGWLQYFSFLRIHAGSLLTKLRIAYATSCPR